MAPMPSEEHVEEKLRDQSEYRRKKLAIVPELWSLSGAKPRLDARASSSEAAGSPQCRQTAALMTATRTDVSALVIALRWPRGRRALASTAAQKFAILGETLQLAATQFSTV